MILSNSMLLCVLPSGNKAVYEVEPQHLNDYPGSDLNTRALQHGRQIAHEKGGAWFKPGGWEEITDLKIIALLERCPDATTPAVKEV